MSFRGHNLFLARAASIAPEQSDCANDATRDAVKLYARQKSFDYHYYQYTRADRCLSPSFDKKKPYLPF